TPPKEVVNFLHLPRKVEGSITTRDRVDRQEIPGRIQDVAITVVQMNPGEARDATQHGSRQIGSGSINRSPLGEALDAHAGLAVSLRKHHLPKHPGLRV